MKKISASQQMVYDFVKQYQMDRGFPPSVREICDGVGLSSTSTVHGHLHRLEKRGLLIRDPAKPRALEIVELRTKKLSQSTIPLIGRVTAGVPIMANQEITDYVTLPASYTRGEDAFMLDVVGDSMIEAGIISGDQIIVQPNLPVANGDIVVAQISDNTGEASATVKRFFKEDSRIRLQPENIYMKPIYVDDCTVLGKVVGLLRKF